MKVKHKTAKAVLKVMLLVLFFVFQYALCYCDIGLYESWEAKVENKNKYRNPYIYDEINLRAIFTSPSGNKFNVYGFYDGDGEGGSSGNIWKIRFMPDEIGQWTYRYDWSDGTMGSSGSFIVSNRIQKKNHGHVKVDKYNKNCLVHDDGTPHYWWGANWISATNYGLIEIKGEKNGDYVSNEKFFNLLDKLEEYEHNGLLLKIALFPLEDDKYSWDLEWLHRAEWLVEEMGQRGIYVHINIFDTWSRERGKIVSNINGDKQVFNVWENGDEDAKLNYIQTIIARFSGFYNVYWELGNEMEHHPNSGEEFIKQANSKYIPWIRENDPYQLPIGLSEQVSEKCEVDIIFAHQPAELLKNRNVDLKIGLKEKIKMMIKSFIKKNDDDDGGFFKKPLIMNELVRGGITDRLWKDSTIRDSTNRLAYRRTFWLTFTIGGTGSSEATWLNFKVPLNQAVLDVMADQKRFRKFIEALPVNINEMENDNTFVVSGPGRFETRSLKGIMYVSYFLVDPGEKNLKGNLKVNLPKGKYHILWFDPKNGKSIDSQSFLSRGKPEKLQHPEFVEDIVLKINIVEN
jgi:hypothetical protein